MDDKVALLRAVPLFAELDERSLQAIATLAREHDATAGDVLMREGEPGDTFVVIVDGTVRVEQEGRDIRSMMAGGFLGEIALLEHGPRTATATCVTDCRLLTLGHFEFDRLLATFPDVRSKVLAVLARRARAQAT
ncbi:MAG TPA: cyclic nucleotide-binding domain-containing protein [Candidatus Limnocylindrales bacterium]|nr:cyclic nucleotide-binding domain-containing protein [Candidatus Limnocylindrales bacterium]